MDLNPKEMISIVYALRFKIEHLKPIADNPSTAEDEKNETQDDIARLEMIAQTVETEVRRILQLKPDEPI